MDATSLTAASPSRAHRAHPSRKATSSRIPPSRRHFRLCLRLSPAPPLHAKIPRLVRTSSHEIRASTAETSLSFLRQVICLARLPTRPRLRCSGTTRITRCYPRKAAARPAAARDGGEVSASTRSGLMGAERRAD